MGDEINEEFYMGVCDSISDFQICSVCTQLINPEYSAFENDLWTIIKEGNILYSQACVTKISHCKGIICKKGN